METQVWRYRFPVQHRPKACNLRGFCTLGIINLQNSILVVLRKPAIGSQPTVAGDHSLGLALHVCRTQTDTTLLRVVPADRPTLQSPFRSRPP